MSEKRWCWSLHREEGWEGEFATRDEAEEACRFEADGDYEVGQVCGYVSECRPLSVEVAGETFDSDAIMERMEEVEDEASYCFDDPTFVLVDGITEEQADAALSEVLREWARKYVTAQGRFICEGDAIEVRAR